MNAVTLQALASGFRFERIVLAVIFATFVWHDLVLTASQSSGGKGVSTISGRVTEVGSEGGVSGASVRIISVSGAAVSTVVTALDGSFAVRDLPRGVYRVAVSARGFLDGMYGQLWPGGPTSLLDLSNDNRTISISLWKTCKLSGRVLTGNGRPLTGVAVNLLPRPFRATTSNLKQLKAISGEDGVFVFRDIPPGQYLLSVIQHYRTVCPQDGSSSTLAKSCSVYPQRDGIPVVSQADGVREVYSTTFFPGVPTEREAARLSLLSGEERTEVELVLTPSRTTEIVGRVIAAGPQGPGDRGLSGAVIRLEHLELADGQIGMSMDTNTSSTDDLGRFALVGVAPGEYVRLAPSLNDPHGVAGRAISHGGWPASARTTALVVAPRRSAFCSSLNFKPSIRVVFWRICSRLR